MNDTFRNCDYQHRGLLHTDRTLVQDDQFHNLFIAVLH